MDISYIYKNRLIIQDEDFSWEFFTKVFPEMLWDDCDKAMDFVKKLIELSELIKANISEKDISEKNMYFTVTGQTVTFRFGKQITPKTIDELIKRLKK